MFIVFNNERMMKRTSRSWLFFLFFFIVDGNNYNQIFKSNSYIKGNWKCAEKNIYDVILLLTR